MVVETDASNVGYGGILKQRMHDKEQLVHYHYGIWHGPQQNYSTIKRKILSIVLCIYKFQDDRFNKKFLMRIDCKSAKHVLQKDVKNLASRQIFARWQAVLPSFDFDIEFIKGENNSLTDFLTGEFLQGKSDKTPFMQVFTMSKKDKGKGTQMNDDYKIVPTKNSFRSPANFPPLPYKTVVTKPSRDNYFL